MDNLESRTPLSTRDLKEWLHGWRLAGVTELPDVELPEFAEPIGSLEADPSSIPTSDNSQSPALAAVTAEPGTEEPSYSESPESEQPMTVLYFSSQPPHPAFTEQKVLTASEGAGDE